MHIYVTLVVGFVKQDAARYRQEPDGQTAASSDFRSLGPPAGFLHPLTP